MSPEDRTAFEKMKRELEAIKMVSDIAFIENMTRRLDSVFNIPRNLADLRDVKSTAPSTGQVLKYNGTAWEPGTDNIE